MLSGRGEHDPAPVERLVGAAGPARMLERTTLADHALPAEERGRVFEDAEGRFVESGVDPLALAGRVAMAKRDHDPERGEEPGHVVGIYRSGPRRWTIGMAVQIPRPPEGRRDRRESRPLVEGARLAEGRDARHHQTRIDRVERLPAEPPALEHARAEVLEHDVAARDETPNDLLPLRRSHVERHE